MRSKSFSDSENQSLMRKDADNTFFIKNTTKGKHPRLPFVEMKKVILGESYELSLVFAGDALTRKLNRIYRQKDKPANVLSFPISKQKGEIFINLKRAKKEAQLFEDSYQSFVGFLFIHGALHLKGMDHGGRMERAEKKLRTQFGI